VRHRERRRELFCFCFCFSGVKSEISLHGHFRLQCNPTHGVRDALQARLTFEFGHVSAIVGASVKYIGMYRQMPKVLQSSCTKWPKDDPDSVHA
jgi:hypothetical protein